MGPFDLIEKLINEHGSAEILQHHLAFAKDQFEGMERKVSDLQVQVAKVEAKLESEESAHTKTKTQLAALEAEHEEDVRVLKGVEFRKGKRTGNQWMAFCPKCHLPLTQYRADSMLCMSCSWSVAHFNEDIEQVIARIK